MPGKDYYSTLELSRDATVSQIKKAYKRLALKYHPDKNPDDRDGAEVKFKEVSEAYAVLSDEKKKAIYDRVGEAGLNGAAGQQRDPDDDGSQGFGGFQQGPGQSFSNADAARVFQAFFGGADPFGGGARGGGARGGGGFQNMFQSMGGTGGGMPFSMGGMGGGMPFSMGGMGGMPDEMGAGAPPLQEVAYGCTLEEIANGTKKKLNVTRKRQRGAEDGKKLFEIDVKPGYKAGTKVTFENEGDFLPQYNRNADLVFRLEEKPHPKFTRHGSDLHCKVTIELRDALLGTVINVPTLYGKTVPVTLSGVTSSGKKYRVNGEGMPDRKNSNAKGDLYVEVIVKMPTKLTEEQKQLIAKAFPV